MRRARLSGQRGLQLRREPGDIDPITQFDGRLVKWGNLALSPGCVQATGSPRLGRTKEGQCVPPTGELFLRPEASPMLCGEDPSSAALNPVARRTNLHRCARVRSVQQPETPAAIGLSARLFHGALGVSHFPVSLPRCCSAPRRGENRVSPGRYASTCSTRRAAGIQAPC